MDEQEELESLITALMEEYNLSLTDIARELGIAYRTLAAVRSGERSATNTLQKLKKLAMEYGVLDDEESMSSMDEQRRNQLATVKTLRAAMIPPAVIRACGEYLRWPDMFIIRALTDRKLADMLVAAAAKQYQEQLANRERIVAQQWTRERPPVHYAAIFRLNCANRSRRARISSMLMGGSGIRSSTCRAASIRLICANTSCCSSSLKSLKIEAAAKIEAAKSNAYRIVDNTGCFRAISPFNKSSSVVIPTNISIISITC